MSRQQFTIGVFVIILNEKDEVLLKHRTDYDFWDLPGGGMEDAETPWEGCIREVREETGLEIGDLQLVGVYSKPEENDLVLQFSARVVGGELILNEEAREFGYFSFKNIPQNTSPNQVERIQKYLLDKEQMQLVRQDIRSAKKLAQEGGF